MLNQNFGQTNTSYQGRLRTPSALREYALLLVNTDRQTYRLKPLIEDKLITLTAQQHAEDMQKRNYFSHSNLQGQEPSDRYRLNGGIGGIGENITYISTTNTLKFELIEDFQKGWMKSPGHRENLLTPHYTKFGYGIYRDPIKGAVYAVQNFQ